MKVQSMMKVFLVGFTAWSVSWAAAVKESDLLSQYHSIQSALAKDDLGTAQKEAKELETKLQSWVKENPKSPVAAHASKMLEGTKGLTASNEKVEVRKNFGVLSEGAVNFVKSQETLKSNWKLYQCPMAKGYQYWLQPSHEEKLLNPYMGTSMQQCGTKKPWG